MQAMQQVFLSLSMNFLSWLGNVTLHWTASAITRQLTPLDDDLSSLEEMIVLVT